jgi:hypothetical protein
MQVLRTLNFSDKKVGSVFGSHARGGDRSDVGRGIKSHRLSPIIKPETREQGPRPPIVATHASLDSNQENVDALARTLG